MRNPGSAGASPSPMTTSTQSSGRSFEMKSVEFIRMGLELSAGMALKFVDSMKDRPLTFPTPKGGNHPLWVIGHLAWTEGELQQVMLGRANPLAHWKEIFGAGSEPSADARRYPSLDETR